MLALLGSGLTLGYNSIIYTINDHDHHVIKNFFFFISYLVYSQLLKTIQQ